MSNDVQRSPAIGSTSQTTTQPGDPGLGVGKRTLTMDLPPAPAAHGPGGSTLADLAGSTTSAAPKTSAGSKPAPKAYYEESAEALLAGVALAARRIADAAAELRKIKARIANSTRSPDAYVPELQAQYTIAKVQIDRLRWDVTLIEPVPSTLAAPLMTVNQAFMDLKGAILEAHQVVPEFDPRAFELERDLGQINQRAGGSFNRMAPVPSKTTSKQLGATAIKETLEAAISNARYLKAVVGGATRDRFQRLSAHVSDAAELLRHHAQAKSVPLVAELLTELAALEAEAQARDPALVKQLAGLQLPRATISLYR